MSDLIDRKVAFDVLTDYYHHRTDAQHDALKEALSRVPSAEPERKKGKWIKYENPTLGQCLKIVYECSVCHKGVGCEYFVRRSFCPNCGADMRGER